jgi:hypothetical protein
MMIKRLFLLSGRIMPASAMLVIFIASTVFAQDLDQLPEFLEDVQLKYVIESDGFNGGVFINDIQISEFRWLGEEPLSGQFAFRRLGQRNFAVDNMRISQIAEDGTETLLFEDDFEREELGDQWSLIALGENPADPLDIFILDGELNSEGNSIDTPEALITANVDIEYAGKTTIIEFTLVFRWGDENANPGILLGSRQTGYLIELGADSEGIPLASTTWGRQNDAWVNGLGQGGRTLDKVDYYTQQGLIPIDGKKIQYVIEPDGLNGTLYIAGFRIGTFTWLGNALEGGVGIRRYSTRNNILDDFRIIQEDSSGQEIILFEDDFNRESLGDSWRVVALGGSVDEDDFRIEDGMLNNSQGGDATADQMLVPEVTFNFIGNQTTIEFTLVERRDDKTYNPGIVIGNETFGILVELIESEGLPAIASSWGRTDGTWVNEVGESETFADFEQATSIADWYLR